MRIRRLSSRLLTLGLTSFLSASCGGINSPLEDFVNRSCTINYADSFDYCTLNETSDPVDQLMAGNSVPTKVLVEGDLEEIKSMDLGKDNISSIKDRDYKILLVPVGYGNSRQSKLTAGYFAVVLTWAFKGVNVSFSYLDTSVPISIEHVERFPMFTNKEEINTLHDKIENVYHTNGLAILLNSSKCIGSGGENPIFSTECSNSLNMAIHEVGHALGLGDGYKRYYSPRELDGRELFVSSGFFGSDVLEAFKNVQPPVKFTGNYCKCLPVYTYYEEDDIMDITFSNSELLGLLREGKSPFNPFQIELMNIKIRNALGKTKK